jgi:hypothetical protein
MQHTEEVDMILAVLGSQEMVVYGSALLRHMIADGEEVPVYVARIPIGRPESVAVLQTYFGRWRRVTEAEVLQAHQQIPGLEQALAADARLNGLNTSLDC